MTERAMESNQFSVNSNRICLQTDQDFIDFCRPHLVGIDDADQITVNDISGNINRVRQVSFLKHNKLITSVIVKVVPRGGFLEKYPEIQFPEDRLHYEAAYYELSHKVQETSLGLSKWAPHCIHFDQSTAVLLLEDLNPGALLETLSAKELSETLSSWLADLAKFHEASQAFEPHFKNNPSFQENLPFVLELPIKQPELMQQIWQGQTKQDLWESCQKFFFEQFDSVAIEAKAEILKTEILNTQHPVLLHGDLHLGSLFKRDSDEVSVIDMELCHWGPGWYDLGVLLAHWHMKIQEDQWLSIWQKLTESYLQNRDIKQKETFIKQSQAMAGFEIIRRVIGAANSENFDDVSAGQRLLEQAVRLILD